jgi:hypothetical protein
MLVLVLHWPWLCSLTLQAVQLWALMALKWSRFVGAVQVRRES